MAIEQLIAQYGPPAVFAGGFFEGETSAVLGGLMAHRLQGAGLASGPGMALMVALGAWSADQMWFLLSRHAPDRGVVQRLRAKAAASRAAGFVDRHRMVLALTYRFVPGLRMIGPVLLAQTGMRWPVFLAINTGVVAVWASLFTAIGYHFGLAAEHVLGRLHPHHWTGLLVAVAVAGVAGHLILRRRSVQKPPDQA